MMARRPFDLLDWIASLILVGGLIWGYFSLLSRYPPVAPDQPTIPARFLSQPWRTYPMDGTDCLHVKNDPEGCSETLPEDARFDASSDQNTEAK